MAAVVVDTDVVSFQYKGKAYGRLFEPLLDGNECILSFATLGELDRWVVERRWGPARIAKLEEHIRLNFAVYYADRIFVSVVGAGRRTCPPLRPTDWPERRLDRGHGSRVGHSARHQQHR